jgi:glycosyltransferase involved in cell wall biosynthesis
MKISCCMIVRDEAKNLAHCLESVRPYVDELCILDTGSTDDSPAIAKKYADKWSHTSACNDAEGRIADFSLARNINLGMATGDVLLWLDGDDELVGGQHLRELARQAPKSQDGAFQVVAPYEYDHDAQGRCTTLQWRERLVGPLSGFEWRGPVHEGLLGKAGCAPVATQTDQFHVKHRRRQVGKTGAIDRNLRILRAWFGKHGESDVRLMHYYGAELLQNRQIGEAKRWLRRHAVMAPWSDERCLSLLHLARIELGFGDGEEAAKWATEAMTTKSWPEPLWVMGQAYLLLSEQGIDPDHNLRRGVAFLERGFEQAGPGPTPTLLMTDPTLRWEAHAWLGAGLARMGRIEEAIHTTELGIKGMPEHPTMQANLKAWKPEVVRNRIRAGIVELHELGALEQSGGIAIDAVLRGQYEARRLEEPPPRVPQPRKLMAHGAGALQSDQGDVAPSRPSSSGRLRIAFWLGHQLEPWTPETLERDGMGGSETMAWELSKRLAKLGHDVTVFGHMPPGPGFSCGNFAGVKWLDSRDFAHFDCDVLIVSRQCEAVTLPHTAKARVLWLHDVHCGPAFTPAIASKYDFVWCLSNWHKGHVLQVYPWLHPDKVEVTRNGIDPDRFRTAAAKRNPHRAIYSSSPDRGLAEAVRAWPAVRAAIPDAELHCYYGFEGWARSIELCGENGLPQCSRAALEALKKAVAETPGVVMHGRVNQKQLAEAMLGAGVWFYPTWFSETSCITAMEAQAAGLWCVCPPLAALAETVRVNFWGDPAEEVIKSMQSKPFCRESAQITDDRFSLDTLAHDWQKRLTELVREAEERVVPRFMEAAQ